MEQLIKSTTDRREGRKWRSQKEWRQIIVARGARDGAANIIYELSRRALNGAAKRMATNNRREGRAMAQPI